MGKIKEDDLLFFYFGVELNAREEEKKKACIRKGYLDMCRSINYLYSTSAIQEKKKNEISQINDFKKGKDNFYNLVEEELLNALENYNNDFEGWYKCLFDGIYSLSLENRNIFFKEKPLSTGQIQKWINMTLKYMYIMGILPDGMEKEMHVPLDSYILKAIKRPEKSIGECSVCGLGIRHKITSWNDIGRYEDYIKLQEEIRKKCKNMKPIDWERKAWIAESIIENNKKKN